MRKDVITTALVPCVAGVFGAFFRWLQLLGAFEKDTGLSIPGARTTALLSAYLLLSAAVFLLLSLWLARRRGFCSQAGECLRPSGPAPELVFRCCGLLTAFIGVLLMLSAPADRYPTMSRLFAGMAIFGGAGLFLSCPGRDGSDGAGRFAVPVVTLFLCMWLVRSYKYGDEEPVLWAIAPEILALSAGTLAWYELSGWFYGRVKPRLTLFWLQEAIFLNIVTLADSRTLPHTALFLAQIACLTVSLVLLAENSRPSAGRGALSEAG